MKKLLLILCIILPYLSHAQETAVKKLDYIIIVNDSIVSKDKINQLAQAGDIKAMQKGVSDEEMAALKEKFGERVGDDKRFIIIISLLNEEEKKKAQSQPQPAKQAPAAAPADEGYVLNVNDRAADFTVDMLDGQKVTLSELKGKVVLINFWATWCGPCMMEFQELPEKIIAPFKDKEFVFIPISRGEKTDVVAKTMTDLKKKGIDFNVALDPDKKTWDKYGRVGIPKNYLIDKQGVIRYVSTGFGENKVDQLAGEIRKLLNER